MVSNSCTKQFWLNFANPSNVSCSRSVGRYLDFWFFYLSFGDWICKGYGIHWTEYCLCIEKVDLLGARIARGSLALMPSKIYPPWSYSSVSSFCLTIRTIFLAVSSKAPMKAFLKASNNWFIYSINWLKIYRIPSTNRSDFFLGQATLSTAILLLEMSQLMNDSLLCWCWFL